MRIDAWVAVDAATAAQVAGAALSNVAELLLVTTPDSNNPLNLFTSIGGKVTLGVTRFEDKPGVFRIVRTESASTI